jgi:ribosome modulation factor
VLRIPFEPKREEVIGGWRKKHNEELHNLYFFGGWRKMRNEELHNLYFLPSIIRMMKSRGMRWAGHVA